MKNALILNVLCVGDRCNAEIVHSSGSEVLWGESTRYKSILSFQLFIELMSEFGVIYY